MSPQEFLLHNVKFPNTEVVMNYLIFTHKKVLFCAHTKIKPNLRNINILIQPGRQKYYNISLARVI